jgi:hypothetical protein
MDHNEPAAEQAKIIAEYGSIPVTNSQICPVQERSRTLGGDGLPINVYVVRGAVVMPWTFAIFSIFTGHVRLN